MISLQALFMSPIIYLMAIAPAFITMMILVVRMILLFTLRKCYPEMHIDDVANVCIKLTSFNGKKDN